MPLVHVGHCGVVAMKKVSRCYLGCPQIDKQLEEAARICHACQSTQPALLQVPMPRWTRAQEPWHMLPAESVRPVKGGTFRIVVDATPSASKIGKWLIRFR